VPSTGGVVAAFEFLARLASRPDVHSIHHIYTGYYTFSTQPYPTPTGVGAMLADVGDHRLANYVKPDTPIHLRDLIDRNRLRPVDSAGDLVLFLREPADTVELVRAGAPPAAVARQIVYEQQLAFVGSALPETTVALGGRLEIQTHWRRVAPVDRQYLMQLVVRDEGGNTVFSLTRYLGYLVYPVTTWPADTTVRETYRMVIPSSLRPGSYALDLRVAWWQAGRPVLAQPDDPAMAERSYLVELGRITIVHAPRPAL
jgi:hypothetical protein